AAIGFSTAAVWVFTNNGTGSFTLAATLSTQDAGGMLAAGDLNGDGYDDIAATNYSSNTMSVFLSTGSATYASALNYATGGQAPFGVTIGDFDRDGHPDVAVGDLYSAGGAGGGIDIFKGSSNG